MSRSTIAILALILLVGAFLRFWHIGAASYWYDEFGSLETSAAHRQEHEDIPSQVILQQGPDLLSLQHAAPAWKIWVRMDEDFNPPLYFVLLRLWRDVFGSTEAATRSLSAIAGLLAILCIFDVGRLAHGIAAGLWAAAICAVAGPQVVYAQETRGYTLLVLWGLCALDAMVRIEVMGWNRRRMLALVLSVLAMLLTHYIGIPVAFALAIYSLIFANTKNRWWMSGAILAAALIFAAIWGPFMPAQRQIGAGNDAGFLAAGEWSRWYSLQHLISLPLDLLGPPIERDFWTLWPVAIIYVLPCLLARKNRFLLLWLFWLLGSAGLFAILDQLHPTHHFSYTRYILMCGPGFYLIYAGLLSVKLGPTAINRALPHILPALAVLFCLVSLPSSFADRRWADWRQIARAIDGLRQPGDALVFASRKKSDWFAGQYIGYAWYAKKPLQNVAMLFGPAHPAWLAEMRRFHSVVVVNGDNSPENLLPGYRTTKWISFMPFVTLGRLELDNTLPTRRNFE